MLGGSPGTFDEERKRLLAARSGVPWRKWGPYLSERQWGTVREDYSPDGTAWAYFSHDQARSRATRWGEDGLAPAKPRQNGAKTGQFPASNLTFRADE